MSNLDFGSNDTNVCRICNKTGSDETPAKVGKGWDEESPPVRKTDTKDPGGAESSSDVATILVTSPESKDETTILHTSLITEPVSHNSSSNRSSSGLEKSEDGVDQENKDVSKQDIHSMKVKPKRDIDQE
jgi:hypothetical protein